MPKKGDFVEITWVDITVHSTTDPSEEEVNPYIFVTRGWYQETKTVDRDRGEFIILSDTRRVGEKGYYGAHCFPVGCIRKIRRLKC